MAETEKVYLMMAITKKGNPSKSERPPEWMQVWDGPRRHFKSIDEAAILASNDASIMVDNHGYFYKICNSKTNEVEAVYRFLGGMQLVNQKPTVSNTQTYRH